MDAFERAKQVLDLCAFELHTLSIDAQMNLQYAISSVIEQAVKEALEPFSKQIKETPHQPPLLKIRRKVIKP